MISNDKLQIMTEKADQMIGLNLKLFTRKRIIKILRSKSFSQDPFFWNNGVLSYALNSYGELKQDSNDLNNQSLASRKQDIRYIDDTLYFFANYSSLRDPRSIADFIHKYPRSISGSIQYRSTYDGVFIDSLGMICAFLLKYSKLSGDKSSHDLAVLQFVNFFKNGFDDITGFPYHGFNSDETEKLGIIGWGRAVGWLLFGLSESMEFIDKTDQSYELLCKHARLLVENICAYQRIDGGFSWQLQASKGPLDSSATAMIGYAIAKLERLKILNASYSLELKYIYDCLESCLSTDGFIEYSSAECLGFSMYPQIYKTNAWGQGFSILFLIEYSKYGKNK